MCRVGAVKAGPGWLVKDRARLGDMVKVTTFLRRKPLLSGVSAVCKG